MGAIDFTDMQRRNKAYAGANGKKISVLYDGEQYMLKFPSMAKKNPNISYSNSCFSEYLGCRIFEIWNSQENRTPNNARLCHLCLC